MTRPDIEEGVARMMVDEFLPLFDSSDELAVVVQADPASTWAALMEADRAGERRA